MNEDESALVPLHEWFCHSCGQRGVRSTLEAVDSGDYTCPLCGVNGFVELVSLSEDQLQSSDNSRSTAQLGGQAFLSGNAASSSRFQVPTQRGSRQPATFFNASQSRETGLQVVFENADFTRLIPVCPPPLRRQLQQAGVHFVRASGGDSSRSLGVPTTITGDAGIDMFIRTLLEAFNVASGEPPFDTVVRLIMENDTTTNRFGTPPASVAALAQLPELIVTEDTAQGDCAICQDDFVVGDTLKRLSENDANCPHKFHANCILPWLAEHNSCPVCRFELPTDDPYYERRRQEVRQRVVDEFERHTRQSNNEPRSSSSLAATAVASASSSSSSSVSQHQSSSSGPTESS